MSELNKDQEVAENRKKPLKGVDAPLRDQIVAKLFASLDEKNIGQRVDSLWMRHSANRATWLERQKVWLESWDEFLVGNTEGSFDGSSQLHMPVTFTVVKTMHARYNQALWQDPPFNVKARNEASMERTATVADTLRYYLVDGANFHRGVDEVLDAWVWDWLTIGTGLMKWRWDIQYTRFVDVKQVVVPGTPKIISDENGKTIAAPQPKLIEKEEPVTKKVFDGPVLENVDNEDLAIIGHQDPDLAEAVIHRQWLTASDLWQLADRKIFRDDRVQEVIEGGPDKEEAAIGNDMKTARARNAGKARLDGDKDLDRYEILEAYLKVDVDSSGINADVIVWVHRRSRKLLRATYLYRVSPSGERPIVKADFQRRKGQEFAMGLPEMLYPLSQEIDAMHNMRIDNGLISTMPFGFYRATSGIDPETISLAPGALIPVDNPQTDVFFPNLGNRTVFGMQEEQALQTMIERLTSISDLNLGLMQGQGATRTATGARALVGEMSANLDVYLRRLNRGWKKSLRYLLHMLQKRIPPGTSFRLTGDDGQDYWEQVKTADDIAGDYDIEVSPNSSTSNPQIQQDVAQQVMQLVSNPLAIQMGLVGPGQYYEGVRAQLQAMGVKDYGKYIQKPQGYEHLPTPEEEANRILHGVPVPVTPNMDHQGFIDYFQHIHDNDELLGQFTKEQTFMLARQAQIHAQMLKAVQAQQAQAANANQMRVNAQMSAQQAPVGANPMARPPGLYPAGQPPGQQPAPGGGAPGQ